MLDASSIPQPQDDTDYNALLNEFSVNGAGVPLGLTQERSEDGAAPGYWRTQMHTLPAFLERPAKQWHVDKVIGVQDNVLIYGESGHGKTHVALDLAFSCVTGRDFAGVFPVSRPLTVVYCGGEGTSGLSDRLRALTQFYGVQDVSLYIFPDVPQLFQATLPNGALAFGREWQAMAADGLVPAQIDILLIDTLHLATAGADENSAKDAGIIQTNLRWLREMLGCTTVLVHHAGKNGVSERGSSAIRASADTVLRVSKVGNGYVLACEKQKDGDRWPAQAFSLVCPPGMTEGVRISWNGDAKRQESDRRTHADKALEYLLENVGRKFTASAIAEAIGLQGGQAKGVYRDLKALKFAGSVREEYTGKTTPALWYCEKELVTVTRSYM